MENQYIGFYLRDIGKRGGEARAKNMTPAERTDAARKAARARWSKDAKPRKRKAVNG
jgi:hypothetical protein